MAKYIKREDAYITISDYYHYSADFPLAALREALDRVPAADVVERKTGKWIYPSDITGFGRCSECKALWDYSLITNKYFKICPRCGSYNGGDEDV